MGSHRHNCGQKRLFVDCFAEGVIRRVVLNFYARKIVPSLEKIHHELMADNDFPRLSKTSLWRIMKKQLKFKFVNFNGKPIPLERSDIAAARAHYLKQISYYRRKNYEVRDL